MSRKKAGTDDKRARAGRSRRRLLGAVTLTGLAISTVVMLAGGASAHPTPRQGVTAEEVVPHGQYHGHPRIQSVYRQAGDIPEVLDGLHCYCECGSHSGHYSLLDCFKSDHGAGCDVCLTSAAIAFRMNQQGSSLQEIREAIDDYFQK